MNFFSAVCVLYGFNLISNRMLPRIVVCASGEGTNFEAIVLASREGRLRAEVVGLIVNRSTCGAVSKANSLGVPVAFIGLKSFPDRPQWDQAMASKLAEWRADWVVLAGFLALIGPAVLNKHSGKIVNSHPALLPKFGGEGMYGGHVHRAVVAAGERETGVTIHLVDEHFDHGRIIRQEKLQVHPGESAESLESRVKALELQVYPKVLDVLVSGKLS